MKSAIFLILFASLLLSFSTQAQDKSLTQQEKKAVKLITSLKEVVSLNNTMMKKNGRPVIIEIDKVPTTADPYFTISVSENLEDRSFTYYRFCINAKTYALYYYETIEGKKVSLKTWRDHGSKP